MAALFIFCYSLIKVEGGEAVLFAIVIGIIVSAVILFFYLIQQSKKPRGKAGILMMKMWNKAYLPMVRWALKGTEGRKCILDVGVGNGASTLYLRQLFPEAEIRGIDISEEGIQEAKSLDRTGDIEFLVCGIEKTPFVAGSFDLICAFQTHFHWQDQQASFKEITRLLSETGCLIVACEYAKLKFYLKDWTDGQALESFLADCGLMLLSYEKNNEWTAFYIGKSKNRKRGQK